MELSSILEQLTLASFTGISNWVSAANPCGSWVGGGIAAFSTVIPVGLGAQAQ